MSFAEIDGFARRALIDAPLPSPADILRGIRVI